MRMGGYPTTASAYEIVERRGVELIAPVNRGPMDAGMMGRDRFEFDDSGHVVSCPEGHPAIDHKILSNNSTTLQSGRFTPSSMEISAGSAQS